MRRDLLPPARDAALAAGLAIGVQAELLLADPVPGGVTGWNVLLGLAVTVPLAWRRRHPVAIGLGVQAVYAVATLLFPVGELFCDGVAVFLVAPYTAAVGARTWRTSVHCGLASCVILGAQGVWDPVYDDGAGVSNALYVVVVWAVAAAVRVQADRAARSLAEARAAIDSRERLAADRAAEAVSRERARVARELHDVVAHALSIVVLQARGARHTVGRDVDEAVKAMREVEDVARRALVDMRHMLGVLREEPDPDGGLRPLPGLRRLDDLVEPVRGTGLRVEVRSEGAARPLTPGVDVSAYRIVQEALTNVLRHANARRAEVTVRWTDTEVELEVRDDGSPAPDTGNGRGLLGMRERVEVLGGSLSAGPQPAGGYAVRARLPVGET
ncbi:sensor histidine kinase [Virgisporangium ochraceum]|nr:sensor histidine kinase [Virgisporangium ochraceum]